MLGIDLSLTSRAVLGAVGMLRGGSLYLDFLNGAETLDPRISFTRASGGTRTNSSGVLELVATNAPRFDYDPVTRASRGLLIEEQRTNLLTYSERFDNADWIKSGATTTANVIAAPDGSLTADRVVEDTSSAEHYIRSSPVSCSAGTYVASVYWHISSERSLYLRVVHIGETNPTSQVVFDKSTLTINTATGNAVSASAQNVGNGWWRISLVFSIAATRNVQHGVQLWSNTGVYTGDGTSGIYIWGAQLEVGASVSSYIPTSGAAATRAADIAPCTGTNFSSWYRADEGTIFVEGDTTDNAVPCFAAFQNASLTQFMRINREFSQARTLVSINSVTQATLLSGNTFPINYAAKIALSYKSNSFALSLNGGSAVTASSGSVPSVDRLVIGSGGYAGYLNGHIRRIAFFKRAFSAAEQQVLTS